MPDNLKLNVKIGVDAKGFKAALERIKKALDALRGAIKDAGDEADKTGQDIDDLGGALDKIGDKGLPPGIGKDADTARQGVKGLNSGLGTMARRLAAVAAGYVGFQAVRGLGRQIDAYTELNNRIRLVADSERQLANIRDELFAISLRTRSSLSANAQLYSRLAQASKDLGTSQADLLKVTEILNKQVLIGGNNATEAAAGLVQFAQGVASGRLQGDELRSVMENLLGVQQGLIDGFAILRERGVIDFDVNRSNLRKLASEGVLDAELLLNALLAVAEKTEERFEQVAVTIGGAFQNLFTAIFGQLGLLEEGTSAGAGFASAVNALAEVVRPATQSENLAKSVRDQLRRGQVVPQQLTVEVLQGVQDLERKELNRLQQKVAEGVQLSIVEHARLGFPDNGAQLQKALAAVEKQLAAREKLIAAKKREVELNARLAAPKAIEPYKPSDAVAAIGARLLPPEERILAQYKQDKETLEKERQALLDDEANMEQRLNSLREAQAASRVQNLGQDIENLEKNLQSRRDELDALNTDLARLKEERDRNLAKAPATPEARERAQAEARALRERLRAAGAARRRALTEARKINQEFRQDSKELTRFIKEQEKERNNAIESIGKRQLEFLNPFKRARAELKQWEKETLATLRTNAAAYAQYAGQVKDVVQKSLDDIAQREREDQKKRLEERLRNSREAAHGLLRGLEDYGRAATNAAENVETAVENAFKSIEDQLVRLVTKGKFSAKQFLRELAEDTARATIRIGVTGPIAASLGARLRGALPGLPAPTSPAKATVDQLNTDLMAKQDRIINAGEQINTAAKNQLTEAQQQTALLKRIADCSCGADARLQQFRVGGDGGGRGSRLLETILSTTLSRVPQFHRGGVVPGRPGQEVLTLLEGGEAVLPRAALAARTAGAGGPPQQVQVVVENRGANQQEVVEQRAEADGDRLIINVALEDIMRGGPFSQGLQRAFGLQRRTG